MLLAAAFLDKSAGLTNVHHVGITMYGIWHEQQLTDCIAKNWACSCQCSCEYVLVQSTLQVTSESGDMCQEEQGLFSALSNFFII